MQSNQPADADLASATETTPHTYQDDGPFPPTVKFEAAKTWLGGASLQDTCDALAHKARFSREAARQWSHRLGHHLTRHTTREVLAVDETSLFLEDGTEVFGWAALDGDTHEVVFTWVSQGRGGMEAWLVFKNVLRRVRNRPYVVVDAGVWYPWPLTTMGFDGDVVSGGARNIVESFFGSLKNRLEKMRRRPDPWHTRASLQRLLRCHAWWWNHTNT
jgi:transposase-like protein